MNKFILDKESIKIKLISCYMWRRVEIWWWWAAVEENNGYLVWW